MNLQSAISVIFGGWLVMVVMTYVIYIHVHAGDLAYQYADVKTTREEYPPKYKVNKILEEMEEYKEEEEKRREKEEEEEERRAEEEEEEEEEAKKNATEKLEPKAEQEKENATANNTLVRPSGVGEAGGAEQARQPSYSNQEPAAARPIRPLAREDDDEHRPLSRQERPLAREDDDEHRPLSRQEDTGYRPRYDRFRYRTADEREREPVYARRERPLAREDDDEHRPLSRQEDTGYRPRYDRFRYRTADEREREPVYARREEDSRRNAVDERPMGGARYGSVERRPIESPVEYNRAYQRPSERTRADVSTGEQVGNRRAYMRVMDGRPMGGMRYAPLVRPRFNASA